MKDERIIEEMAKLEGLVVAYGDVCMVTRDSQGSPEPCPVPFGTDYLADHNAVQRVIDGLSDIAKREVWLVLEGDMDYEAIFATAPQKCEALLRAAGKWEES